MPAAALSMGAYPQHIAHALTPPYTRSQQTLRTPSESYMFLCEHRYRPCASTFDKFLHHVSQCVSLTCVVGIAETVWPPAQPLARHAALPAAMLHIPAPVLQVALAPAAFPRCSSCAPVPVHLTGVCMGPHTPRPRPAAHQACGEHIHGMTCQKHGAACWLAELYWLAGSKLGANVPHFSGP